MGATFVVTLREAFEAAAPAIDHEQPRAIARLGGRLSDRRGGKLVVEVGESHEGECTAAPAAARGGGPSVGRHSNQSEVDSRPVLNYT